MYQRKSNDEKDEKMKKKRQVGKNMKRKTKRGKSVIRNGRKKGENKKGKSLRKKSKRNNKKRGGEKGKRKKKTKGLKRHNTKIRKEKKRKEKGLRKTKVKRKGNLRKNKCLAVSCVDTAISYLRLLKDKVANYERQTKRVSKQNKTLGNKIIVFNLLQLQSMNQIQSLEKMVFLDPRSDC